MAEEWEHTTEVRSNVTLDEWQIMPNHLHGIIVICGDASVRRLPDQNAPAHKEAPAGRLKSETLHRSVSTSRLHANSLGAIIGQFKGASTRRIRAAGLRDFAWQTRFYDHVIRNSDSLEKIRAYIRHNPLMWELEKDDPENIRL
ncbi:MAG: hypothetical protein P8018_14090 [Acidobacteriota bacterium]